MLSNSSQHFKLSCPNLPLIFCTTKTRLNFILIPSNVFFFPLSLRFLSARPRYNNFRTKTQSTRWDFRLLKIFSCVATVHLLDLIFRPFPISPIGKSISEQTLAHSSYAIHPELTSSYNSRKTNYTIGSIFLLVCVTTFNRKGYIHKRKLQ